MVGWLAANPPEASQLLRRPARICWSTQSRGQLTVGLFFPHISGGAWRLEPPEQFRIVKFSHYNETRVCGERGELPC